MPKPCADRSAGTPRDNTNADHAFRRIRKAPQANGGGSGTGPPTLPLARTLVKPDASSGVRAVPLDVRRQPAGRCLRARAREPPRRAHRLQRWSRPARRVAGAHHGRRGTRARWAAGARFVARPRGRTDRLERAMLRGLGRLHRGRDAGAGDPRRCAPSRGRRVLGDAGVRQELAAGRRNGRGAEGEAAGARLRLELPELVWLASWPVSWLGRLKKALPEPLRARALHVIGETARTRFGAQLLARGRLKSFGRLLYESHQSCRRLSPCRAPELDPLGTSARRA